MGRYDKIKVYDGSEWKQPTRIRVFANNAWQDLGKNESSITRALNVRHNKAWHRATLNRTLVTVSGESYCGGDGFRLLPATGYCYCPNASNTTNATWFFRATIRKVADGDQRVFFTGNSSRSCMLEIMWLASGQIRVTCRTAFGSAGTQTITTTNAVDKNTWVYLNVTCNKGVSKMSVKFNGVTTSGNMWMTFQISNADTWIGSTGVQFKGGMEVQGSHYPGGSNYKYLNATTISGSTADYQYADHVDTSYQEVRWT